MMDRHDEISGRINFTHFRSASFLIQKTFRSIPKDFYLHAIHWSILLLSIASTHPVNMRSEDQKFKFTRPWYK